MDDCWFVCLTVCLLAGLHTNSTGWVFMKGKMTKWILVQLRSHKILRVIRIRKKHKDPDFPIYLLCALIINLKS